MKNSILISLLCLLVISCEQEPLETIVYKDIENSWKQDLRFSGNGSILLNSFASENQLHISAISHWATIDTSNAYEGTLNFENYLNHSIKRKIPITENLFAYYYDNQTTLSINSTQYPWGQYLPHFDLSKYDSTFLRINDYSIGRKNEFIVINKDMYCLIPYQTKSSQPKFFIIKPSFYKLNNTVRLDWQTHKALVRIATPEYEINLPSVYYMTSFNKNFFVNLDKKLFKIDTLGNCNKVLNHNISNIILSSDSLIAVDADYQTYLSKDNGESWQKYLKVPADKFTGSNACFHNFATIDNKIIAYPRCNVGMLYHLYEKDNAFQLDSIPSDGLRYKDITSITGFRDKVYVTTLSGLFFKDKDKLLKNEK